MKVKYLSLFAFCYGISFTETLITYDSIEAFFVVKNLVTTLKAILLIYKSQHHLDKSTSVQCRYTNNKQQEHERFCKFLNYFYFKCYCNFHCLGFNRRFLTGSSHIRPSWRRNHPKRPQRYNHTTWSNWTHRSCYWW